MTTVGVCHRRAGRCVWPTNDQVGTTTLAMCHRHAGRCVPAVVHAGAPRADRALATAAATQGFQWRDAGVGAVGMLLLLAAAAAMVAGRRQHHRVTTS